MQGAPEDDGVDYKHWLIHVEEPRGTRDEMISHYFNIVASVLGSEDDAKKAMYSVSSKYYFGIGVALPKDLAYKFKDNPSVLNVMPDAYVDPVTKDYGGEPVFDGQVAPYHPKHHDLYHRGQEAIRQGMIEDGIQEFPGNATYKRLLNEYKFDRNQKVEDASKPRRPPTAYSLFMKDFRKQYKEQNPDKLDDSPVGKAGGFMWRSMAYEVVDMLMRILLWDIYDKAPYLCVAHLMKRDYQKAIKAYENKQEEDDD